jgi:CheY-like chemotaxis protein/HPt (histidine-containing phosphotransfer) domain-containing protein
VRQVLLNLVGSAVKFTASGHVVVDVTASGADEVTITVSDTGPGLPEDAREQLFAPFVQVDPSTDRRHGGFGLGLAICSRLVDLMGGSIRVDSRPGEGARFVVVLPMPAAPVAPRVPWRRARCSRATACGWRRHPRRRQTCCAAAWSTPVPRSSTTATTPGPCSTMPTPLRHPTCGCTRWSGREERSVVLSSTNEPGAAPVGGPALLPLPVTMARLTRTVLGDTETRPVDVDAFVGRRVLLAEDNEVNALLISRMIALLGLSCDVVADGSQALQRLRENDYDVVLMDVQMPLVDEVAATRALRASESRRRTPVLALTASAAAEEERPCREAGMDGFITKPVVISQLRGALAPYVDPPAAAPTEPPVLDRARLDDLVDQLGDVELVRETVAAYLEELAPRTRGIEDAVSSGDREAFRRLTHTLKSSSAMLGAVAMSAHCARAEAVASTATPEELAALRDPGAALAVPTAQALTAWAAGA